MLYLWIKALHVLAVISWMAGLLYLPRLFVYHVEQAACGSEADQTFQIMERKLLRLIMTPAMVVAWICGLILIGWGGFDWAAGWSWVKLVAVMAMTVVHFWLEREVRALTTEAPRRTGRTYRLVNEVPTVLMLVIVVMVIVRPF